MDDIAVRMGVHIARGEWCGYKKKTGLDCILDFC